MPFLLLAIVCSVLVSVLLKLLPRRALDVGQVVTWNYAAAAALSLGLLRPESPPPGTPWPTLLVLAIALPTIFLVLARAVAVAGIVRSDVAQRLSLVLSLTAAFTVFGERADALRLIGLALGLLAIIAITRRPGRQPTPASAQARAWPWLLAVWAGFAVIDVLLKQLARSGTPALNALSSCFALAFVLMAGWQVLRLGRQRIWPGRGEFAAGLLLGLLNFGNILFYLRAHQALPHNPAVVFATMNIGVVVLGAAVGMLGFGERGSRWNWIGLVLAVIAITLIASGNRG